MSQRQSELGIVSIIFSIIFYVILYLLFTNERVDKLYSENFLIFAPLIFLFLPLITFASAIGGIKQKNRKRLIAIIGIIFSTPVIIISIAAVVIYIIYLT